MEDLSIQAILIFDIKEINIKLFIYKKNIYYLYNEISFKTSIKKQSTRYF